MADNKDFILIASDHYRLMLKNPIRDFFIEKGYDVKDLGVNNEEPVLGSQVIGVNAAKKMIDIWLESEFWGGRSLPKVAMIKAMDEKCARSKKIN